MNGCGLRCAQRLIPKTKKDLRAFLGLILLRNLPILLLNLMYIYPPATAKMAPREINWTPWMLDTYHKLVSKLCIHTLLTILICSDRYV